MKNLLILLAIPLLFISCIRDNDGFEENNLVSFDVSMSIPIFGVYGTDKSANGQAAKSSSFEHIFKDEIDVVFTSTTSDFTATLTITPNDLSSTPSIELPYGTYSWTITNDLISTDGVNYYFPEHLPVYGTGSVEVFSSNVRLDLLVDTNYGLVTVQKENIDSVKIILGQSFEKNLILNDNLYYLYSISSEALYISIKENKYNTTIQTAVGESSIVRPKTHYNYILAFSDVDVNSITLKTAAFEQIDYYLQPTGTASCTLSFDVYKDSWISAQANGVITTTVSPSVEISPVYYRLSSTCSSTTLSATIIGLPDGLTMTYDLQNVATISGTPSAQLSGTYTYTLTGYNSNILSSATSSITAQGSFIVPAQQTSSCEINVLSGSLSQTINVGDSIINIDLMSDDECSTAHMIAKGLPSGLIFSQLSTQFYGDTAYRISGTPSAQAGTYTFVIDNSNWGGSQSISGTIIIDEAQSLTYIPDNNFEQALIDLGHDDVLDDYVLTSNISSITILYVDRKQIDDLTGIEDFESLEKLYVEVNDLTTLDVSNNTNLIHLSANRNFLTCIKLNENQYNYVLPNLFANGDFNWSKFGWENSHNSVIYNTNCINPDMSNVVYVTSNSDSDYTINGKDSNGDVSGLDPDLVFNVGDVIYFYVEADGNGTPHYFHLKTSPTIGTGEQIDIPSGTYKGNVIWKPEQAGTYYYQCRLHNGHGGEITIN